MAGISLACAYLQGLGPKFPCSVLPTISLIAPHLASMHVEGCSTDTRGVSSSDIYDVTPGFSICSLALVTGGPVYLGLVSLSRFYSEAMYIPKSQRAISPSGERERAPCLTGKLEALLSPCRRYSNLRALVNDACVLWSVSITAQDGCPFRPRLLRPSPYSFATPPCNLRVRIKHASYSGECVRHFPVVVCPRWIAPECQLVRVNVHGD